MFTNDLDISKIRNRVGPDDRALDDVCIDLINHKIQAIHNNLQQTACEKRHDDYINPSRDDRVKEFV